MRRRFKISVEGHDYDVVVEEVTDDSGGLYPDRGTMRSAPAEPSKPRACRSHRQRPPAPHGR